MKTFFDSSAFAKRYIEDQNSPDIDKYCLNATSLAVSIICIPEIISALARLKRDSKITSSQFKQGKQALFTDLSDAIICILNQTVIQKTIHALENCQLRAMDAIHIACALEWQSDLFITSDHKQYDAAKKLGIKALLIQ